MSHRFKRPAAIHPQERREERQIKLMALQIHDQGALEKLLAGSTAASRAAMLARLRPYLGFAPAAPNCPACGLNGGSAIAHECRISN